MSAIDNKHLIEIIAVNKDAGISKKTGNAWEMHKAQCIVRGPDGLVKIGELILPKAMADVPPGKYLAGFELDVSFERIVVPRIVELHAWTGSLDAAAPAGGGGKQADKKAA